MSLSGPPLHPKKEKNALGDISLTRSRFGISLSFSLDIIEIERYVFEIQDLTK
jgi:hypothetical protein